MGCCSTESNNNSGSADAFAMEEGMASANGTSPTATPSPREDSIQSGIGFDYSSTYQSSSQVRHYSTRRRHSPPLAAIPEEELFGMDYKATAGTPPIVAITEKEFFGKDDNATAENQSQEVMDRLAGTG